MEDLAEKDRRSLEDNCILYCVINSLMDEDNRSNTGPTIKDCVNILTKRFQKLNIPNIEKAKSWEEIGEVLSENRQKDQYETNSVEFSFTYMAIDEYDIVRYMNQNNLNIKEYLFTLGTKAYIQFNLQYEQNMADYHLAISRYNTAIENCQRAAVPVLPCPYVKISDKDTPSKTMIVSNNFLTSTNLEIQTVVFRDSRLQDVDWNLSLSNLKEFIIQNNYSKKQTRACLLRLVARYSSIEYSLLEEYDDPDIIAKSLLKSESKISSKLKYMSALKNSKRLPLERIESVMAKIERILGKIYSEKDISTDKTCQDILISCLIQFTVGKVKDQVEEEVIARKAQGLYCNYNNLLDRVSQMEYSDPLLRPTTELSFELTRKIGLFNINIGTEEIETYNSLQGNLDHAGPTLTRDAQSRNESSEKCANNFRENYELHQKTKSNTYSSKRSSSKSLCDRSGQKESEF